MAAYFLAPLLMQLSQSSAELPTLVQPRELSSGECCPSTSLGHTDLELRRDAPEVVSPDIVDLRPLILANATSAAIPLAAEPHDVNASGFDLAAVDTPPPLQGPSDTAGTEPAPETRYGAGVFWDQAKSIPWRFGGATAAISIGGFSNWKWGSSSFRFNSEGWFGKETASLGMDKLGHAYSSYMLTEFFTDGIVGRGQHHRSASYTGAILAMGLMTYIEVFDGFSVDHGFSHEDLIVDTAGALFSIARRSVPGLSNKLDFRLLYIPSRSTWRALSCLPAPHCQRDGAAVRGPVTDYSGQRYLLALKLSGFERFKSSPLRLLELHGGYFARGFTKEEEDRGDPLRRRLFVGVGVDVGELLFPGRRRGIAGHAKWALQYLQLPYTAVHSD